MVTTRSGINQGSPDSSPVHSVRQRTPGSGSSGSGGGSALSTDEEDGGSGRRNPRSVPLTHSPSGRRSVSRSGGGSDKEGEVVVYRDLVWFEERLRQNATRLHRKKHEYEMYIGGLFLLLLPLTYWGLIDTPEDTYWVVLIRCALLLALLFIGALYYSATMRDAVKFVPQCNRVLTTFNLRLTEEGDRLQFHRSVPRKLQEGFASFRRSYLSRKV